VPEYENVKVDETETFEAYFHNYYSTHCSDGTDTTFHRMYSRLVDR